MHFPEEPTLAICRYSAARLRPSRSSCLACARSALCGAQFESARPTAFFAALPASFCGRGVALLAGRRRFRALFRRRLDGAEGDFIHVGTELRAPGRHAINEPASARRGQDASSLGASHLEPIPRTDQGELRFR